MTIGWMRTLAVRCSVFAFLVILPYGGSTAAQGRKVAARPEATQQLDEEYTAKIKEHTRDPRILTELVDHLPASATVPTPLKFLAGFQAPRMSLPITRTSKLTSKPSPRRRPGARSSSQSGRARKAAT